MRYSWTLKGTLGGRHADLRRRIDILAALLCISAATSSAGQGSADWWEIGLNSRSPGSVLGVAIGAWPGRTDGYDGGGGLDPRPEEIGIFLLSHRENGPDWNGPTGFYAEDYESPIPPGGSHTWPALVLWGQNYTPDPPNQVQVRTAPDFSAKPPDGYRGHLVLDQIPTSAGWTGPMDYWLDLTVFNTFTLPIATVTDPLQGTRFHLTVYAIPEPSSLAGLLLAAGALVSGALRRRR